MDDQFRPGDLIRVETQFKTENSKEKASFFEGVVIEMRGRDQSKMFTVRRIGANNVGVERIFPLHSPHIQKITVKRKGDVRRANLGYLRQRLTKTALLNK